MIYSYCGKLSILIEFQSPPGDRDKESNEIERFSIGFSLHWGIVSSGPSDCMRNCTQAFPNAEIVSGFSRPPLFAFPFKQYSLRLLLRLPISLRVILALCLYSYWFLCALLALKEEIMIFTLSAIRVSPLWRPGILRPQWRLINRNFLLREAGVGTARRRGVDDGGQRTRSVGFEPEE